MTSSELAVEPDITPTISTWLSSGILVNCGYKHVDIIATLNSAIYVILLLCVSC